MRRGIIYGKNRDIIGIDFSYIEGFPMQVVSHPTQICEYVKRLNTVQNTINMSLRMGCLKDVGKFSVEITENPIKNKYKNFILRPSIPLYERKIEIREGVTLSRGMYYLLAFESANSYTYTQKHILQGRRVFSEQSVVQVPIRGNSRNLIGQCYECGTEMYAANWSLNDNKLILLLKETPENLRVYNILKESLNSCSLALMSGVLGRAGLQVMFLDRLGR